MGIVHGETGSMPVRQRLGFVEQLGEQVDARGRANEHGPAQAVRKRRLDDVEPHLGLDLRHLVNDRAVDAQAAHGVGVVATEQADDGAVVLEGDHEVALVHIDQAQHPQGLELLFQALPGDGFGLL